MKESVFPFSGRGWGASSILQTLEPEIVVIGVGGAGNNAVEAMIRKDLMGVRFVALNTDAQALRASSCEEIVQIGRSNNRGLGAGSAPEIGRAAAEESIADIEEALSGAHMCFIAAGLGGGTGTGAAPIVAEVARRLGILTVAVVTKPFAFEGRRRMGEAEDGLERIADRVDSLIVVPNQNLFRVADPAMTLKDAFGHSDEVLYRMVRSVSDLITSPGFVNLDLADVRSVLSNTGRARVGVGEASGADRAATAAQRAMTDPLLDEDMGDARGLLISISGGEDMLLTEVDEVASAIADMATPDAEIIWGTTHDPELTGSIRVSVVAAGVGQGAAAAAPQLSTIADLVRVSAERSAPAPAKMKEEDELVLTEAELFELIQRPVTYSDEAPAPAAAIAPDNGLKPTLFERMLSGKAPPRTAAPAFAEARRRAA